MLLFMRNNRCRLERLFLIELLVIKKNFCKLETKGREFAKFLRSPEQFSKSERSEQL